MRYACAASLIGIVENGHREQCSQCHLKTMIITVMDIKGT